MANLGYFLQAPGYIQSQNGDYLQSQNNNFFAIVQDDGNFCVYKGTPSNQGAGVWCAMSQQPCQGIFYAAMQADGNLCVYIGTTGHTIGNATWCSGSNSSAQPYFLILEGDGDLNVYAGTPQNPGNLMWSSDPDFSSAEKK